MPTQTASLKRSRPIPSLEETTTTTTTTTTTPLKHHHQQHQEELLLQEETTTTATTDDNHHHHHRIQKNRRITSKIGMNDKDASMSLLLRVDDENGGGDSSSSSSLIGNDNNSNNNTTDNDGNHHTIRIGLISDTHGVLEESALDIIMTNKDHNIIIISQAILHSGDVGDKRPSRLKPKQLLDRIRERVNMTNAASIKAITKTDNNNNSPTLKNPTISPTAIIACRGNVDDAIPKQHLDGLELPSVAMYIEPHTGTTFLILHGDGIPVPIFQKTGHNKTKKRKKGKPQQQQLSDEMCELIRHHQAQIVVFGHSHVYSCCDYYPCPTKNNTNDQYKDDKGNLGGGVLFLNPGSAGPRRFKLPRTCGSVTLSLLSRKKTKKDDDDKKIQNDGKNQETVVGDDDDMVVKYTVQYHDIDTNEIVLEKTGTLQGRPCCSMT